MDHAAEALIEEVKPVELVVRWLIVNMSDGTTISMDTLVGSGAYPNIYVDFTGRVSRYMVRTDGWKAMDLSPYVNKADYLDLGPWTKDGKLLGIPQTVPLQGMGLNLDLLDAAGYKPPPPKDWTVDAFLAMCKAVKALPGKYGTALFAKSPSADYLWMNWFGSFGAQMFRDGDYSKTTLNSPAGLTTMRFLSSLVAWGYAPAESADLWDDAALELWQRGLVAAMPIRPDWVNLYMKAAVDQKWIEKPFRWVMYPFPRGPGVSAVPTIGAGATAVVGEMGSAIDPWAARLAVTLTGKGVQEEIMSTTVGSWTTMRGITAEPKVGLSVVQEDVDAWKGVNGILQTAGLMDVGYTLPQYAAIRNEMPPRLAELYNGKTTPEAALTLFEKRVNDILAGIE